VLVFNNGSCTFVFSVVFLSQNILEDVRWAV
jgi:hypothetical protein